MKRTHILLKMLQHFALLLACLLLIFAAGKAVFMIYNRSIEAFTLGDMAQVWLHGLSMDVSTSCYLLTVPWLCALIWGLGNLIRRQFVKGTLFLAAEAGVVLFTIQSGLYNLDKLTTLGTVAQQKVWNDEKSIFEYVDGDRSLNILLYGIITVAIVVFGLLLLRASVKSAYSAEQSWKKYGRAPTFEQDIKALLDERLQFSLLSLPILGVIAFILLPLIFMSSMAFTNYSVLDSKLVLFDWVGFKNFARTLSMNGSLGSTFWSVLGWTLVWALAATFSNYILGMLLALFINC